MASNFVEWQLNLFDMRLNRPIADSTGLFTVLTAGTATVAATYTDSIGTAQTPPATMNKGGRPVFNHMRTTTGSVTGFLNAVICTVTGWLALTEATTSTVTVNTRGSLLMANAAFARQYHRPANATSGLSLIYQTDATCTTGAQGFIVLEYDRLVGP